MESILVHSGLSHRSARVYISCLQLGTASMTEIAHATNFKRSSTYLLVDELLVKGYLTVRKKGSKSYYTPEPPRKLSKLMQFRLHEVEQLIPQLEALYNEPKEKPHITMYEGVKSLQRVYEEVYGSLNEKQEALFFTCHDDLRKMFPDAVSFFVTLLKKRNNVLIRELCVADTAGCEYERKTKRLRGKNHRIRFLPSSSVFHNTDNIIFDNKLIIFSLRKKVCITVIENSDIAETYRVLFDVVWAASHAL